jgi:arginase family enzyme
MLTTSQLHSFIPALLTTDATVLADQQMAIMVTFAENNGYPGLPEASREIAQALSAASYLTLNKPADVKRYKSYDDEVEYYQRPEADLNAYQTALDRILDSNSFGISVGGECGDCDLSDSFYLG